MAGRQAEVGQAAHLVEGRHAVRVAVDDEAAEQDDRADPEGRPPAHEGRDREGDGSRRDGGQEHPRVLTEHRREPDVVARQGPERHEGSVGGEGKNAHDGCEGRHV